MWQHDWTTNQGLYLEVTEADDQRSGSPSHQIHPLAVGLTSNRNAELNQEVKHISLKFKLITLLPNFNLASVFIKENKPFIFQS